MKRFLPRRPSASLLIACLALMVAVSGGGQAIADTTVSIAKSINGKTIKNKSIAGSKLKANTVTGKQVKESSLATVPSATAAGSAGTAASADNAKHADSAAALDGGTVVKTFNFKGVTGNSQVVLERGGYRVTAACKAGNTPSLVVTNVSAGASEFITNSVDQSGGAQTSTTFAFNTGVTGEAILDNHGTATFTAASTAGPILTGQLFFDNDPSYGGAHAGCAVAGSLVSGP